MLRRLLRQLQHLATALALLLAGAAGVELWFQYARPAPFSVVAVEAEPAAQKALVPSAVVHHQLRPLAVIPGGDGCVEFRTNSLGLRGSEPVVPKPAGTWRVVLLGDDTVSGIWLNDEATLAARLQRHLEEYATGTVEVVNAGVPGYSPLLSSIQYERELSHLSADLVILHFDMSDVADDALHRCRLQEVNQQKACIHATMAGPAEPGSRVINLLKQSAVADLLLDRFSPDHRDEAIQNRYAWTRRTPDDIQLQVRHAMRSVEDLTRQTRLRGQPLLISTAPVVWQVVAPDQARSASVPFGIRGSQPIDSDLPFQILESWSREAGLPFCNPVAAFRSFESPEQLFRPASAQLSENGIKLYGRELAKVILQASVAQSNDRTVQ